jgi:hypothetical protein
MALRTEREELLTAWRALSAPSGSEGWRTIKVGDGGPCPLLAGRHFPGNEEALLVGLDSVRLPPTELLPQGKGFLVMRADIGGKETGKVWVALCRQSQGSLDLFALMAEDIVATLDALKGADGEMLVNVFLARIRAWQEFMRRGISSVLSPEAEVGLYGEIVMLLALVDAGLHPTAAVESWMGPLDGIQDFSLGTGAIEVKSTVSPSGFSAKMGSLEQLDDSLIQPIFLSAIRLVLSPNGHTLTELVASARNILSINGSDLATFESRLIHAGFLVAVGESYTRRFVFVTMILFSVSDKFPRLTRANVPLEVRSTQYVLDLDLIHASKIELESVLKQLGVI